MSGQNGTERRETAREVEDKEGSVDQKLKTRIINARERVDEAEQAIFVEAATDPGISLSRDEQISVWGTVIRQFLRAIEPLLRDNDVKKSTKYYEEIEIGEEVLYPPPTDGYDFTLISQFDDETNIRRALGLPRGVDLPEPKVIEFTGLKDIIETDGILSQQWLVKVDNSGPPPEHEYVKPTVQRMVSKQIFENSVRQADQFLQQAGIGLDLGGETPIIRGFDQSGDEPNADIDNGDYTGDPSI